jgi:putative PIG3 family NAD(P)H quinone oxidoreductase
MLMSNVAEQSLSQPFNQALPVLMRAIDVKYPGPDSELQFVDIPLPIPSAQQVLVKVAAAGVNRADLAQRAGVYPPPPGESPILGLEVAGTIVAVGSEADSSFIGKKVFGLVPGGGYAEYAVLQQSHLLFQPETCSDIEAAATAEVFLTAFQAMVSIGGLGTGDLPSAGAVLLHAGASGVGTAGIQLAKQLGAVVAVTLGSDSKAQDCYALGADICINYKTQDFVSELQSFRPQGFNVIVDPVAGDYIAKDLQLLALDGRIVVLAMMGGRTVPPLDLAPMFKKRGQLICSTLRNRSDRYKAQLCADFSAQFGQALAQGLIKPVLSKVFDWREADAAHQLLASNVVTGKLVLKIDTTN